MFLGLKSPYKAIFSLHFAQIALAAFAVLAGLVASGSVFLNDLYFWGQSGHYINPYLFVIAFFLAFSPVAWGLAAIIFLLPLSAGLGTQLNAYLGTHFLILPNAGLDLVAGFSLGSALREISKSSHFLGKNRHGDLTTALKELAPWPIALVIVMITISTAIAISRNVYQSAAATSFKGLLFNLVHFRPIGWHDDYMPISDWVAYALAVATVVLVIKCLKDKQNKNQVIFRPIVAGLIVAAMMAIAQAITGLGLPESLLSFRKDQLGYAVIGFQPDLHAFAGHMLLGAVGLWGYFYSGISKLERKFILLAVALSWTGLILSKSRALLLIALVVMLVWLVWYLCQKKRHLALPAIAIVVVAISIFVVLIFNYSISLSGIPVLSWLGELANEFKSRDLTSWSLFSGIFGSRFEIWEAAIRMWWEFPLMGIGQGNFYRLSDIASFSKSHFLILNHGENAHNYFLQTLTETGVIGVAVFTFALLAPFSGIKDRRVLIPAVIAILSLFLGNIFSHSFLVRENILLCAALFGLIFSMSLETFNLKKFILYLCQGYADKKRLGCFLVIFIVTYLALAEVIFSYGKKPFFYGYLCSIDRSLADDGWISGIYKVLVPIDTIKVSIPIYAEGVWSSSEELKITFSILGLNSEDGELHYVLKKQGWTSMDILVSRLSDYKKNPTYLQIELSKCYTPRNLGISADSRRLGVKIPLINFSK